MSVLLFRIARWCFRHRRRVVAGWLLVAAVVGTLAVLGHGKEENNITIPGTESQHVADLLGRTVPRFSGAQTQVVLVSTAAGTVTSASYAAGIEATVHRMQGVPQVAEVSDPIRAKAISPDGKEALATVLWKVSAGDVTDASLSALQAAASPARAAGLHVNFGGQVYPGWNPTPTEAPEIIGLLIAFLILLITFGAFAAAGVPILSAIVGVLVTVAGITGLAAVMNVATVSTTVAIMLGLSTGIDYGLFIVSRHRSQLLAGRPLGESVASAAGTAGSSVVFAGATVIAALLGLSVVGIPFLRNMGLIAGAAVAISVLIALTLLPALLGFAGNSVARFIGPRRRTGRAERVARLAAMHPDRTRGACWARLVVRFRRPVALLGVLVAVMIAAPVTGMELGLPSGASQPSSNTARLAYDATDAHFGAGFNGVLLAAANPVTSEQRVRELTARLAAVPGVLSAAPVAFENNTAVIQVVPRTGPNNSATTSLVKRIREQRARIAGGTGTQLLIGGPTASNIDVSAKLSSSLPRFLAVVAVLAFALLTFAFRAPLVPLKSILGFLLSVAAALGAQVALFQWGWGASLLGITKSPVTLSYLPTVLVAIIFGLSCDYEVFVVSRIKEQFTNTGDAEGAVERGTGVSVRVVSAAAMIMFSVFVAFMTSTSVEVRAIAFSFAVGVAVDAFLVRLTLVPAVMAIARARMWWHPRWFAKYVPDPDIEGARLEATLISQRTPLAAAPASTAARSS